MQTCMQVTGGGVNEHNMYSFPLIDNSSNLIKRRRASDDPVKQAIGIKKELQEASSVVGPDNTVLACCCS